MKKMRLVKLMGSCSLALMMAVSGCSANAEATSGTTKEETTATTTEETSEETEDETTAVAEETEEPEELLVVGQMEPGYLIDHHTYSNGQIEDQLLYMNAFPGYENIDLDNVPDDLSISDVRVIEDEDLRNIAQEYQDRGFTIEDPAYDVECGWGIPCDGQYVFNNGFYAYNEGDDKLETFYACKMNEELFNFFVVGYFICDTYELTDDGTVIRYSEGNNYCEFNRDTGIATEYYCFDETGGVG